MSRTSSFFVLIRHALKLYRASRAWCLVSLLFVSLTFLTTLRGQASLHREVQSIDEAERAETAIWASFPRERWLELGVRHGRWLYLPPLSSRGLFDGISATQLGSYHARVGVAPAHRLDLIDGAISFAPELKRFGSFELGFLLLVFTPLWAILLSYGVVSAERQTGTLRELLASSVSRGIYLFSRLCVATLVLVLPFSLAVLLALGVGKFLGYREVPSCVALISFFAIAAAYILIYVAIGTLASSVCATPRSSLALAMGVWVVLTFIIPRVAALSSNLVYPGTSSVADELEKRSLLAEARHAYVEDNHLGLGKSWMVERLLVGQLATERETNLDERFAMRRRRARLLAERLSMLSPFGLANTALMQVAGTSPERYEAFRREADAYRRSLTRLFANGATRLQQNATLSQKAIGEELIPTVPPFHFQERSVAVVSPRTLHCILLLLGISALLLWLCKAVFQHYDVR